MVSRSIKKNSQLIMSILFILCQYLFLFFNIFFPVQKSIEKLLSVRLPHNAYTVIH